VLGDYEQMITVFDVADGKSVEPARRPAGDVQFDERSSTARCSGEWMMARTSGFTRSIKRCGGA